MPRILLINPNTSHATTQMMVDIVQSHCSADTAVHGMTATSGVAMITTPAELSASTAQVLAMWEEAAGSNWDGIVIACFGDPGVELLRQRADCPVIGICEAALREASAGGRLFGIATTTPNLTKVIHTFANQWGLAPHYTGLRATQGDPQALVRQRDALEAALLRTVAECTTLDGAQAVVIGGGPLGQAAQALAPHSPVPLIAPLAAAARWLQATLTPQPPR